MKINKNIKVNSETKLIEELGMNSLSIYELVYSLENDYDIKEKSWRNWKTVGDIVNYIQEHRENQ